MDERLVKNMEEFNRRFAFPRIARGRAEDFSRDLERRWGARLPVRRGDTGCYWEDGAASTAAELAGFRRAQLAARAAELVALWDDRLEPRDDEGAARVARRAAERRAMWRDLLLFGEHTWGADVSVSAPDSRQTVAQWLYKRRFLEAAAAAAERQLAEGLLRIGGGPPAGARGGGGPVPPPGRGPPDGPPPPPRARPPPPPAGAARPPPGLFPRGP